MAIGGGCDGVRSHPNRSAGGTRIHGPPRLLNVASMRVAHEIPFRMEPALDVTLPGACPGGSVNTRNAAINAAAAVPSGTINCLREIRKDGVRSATAGSLIIVRTIDTCRVRRTAPHT